MKKKVNILIWVIILPILVSGQDFVEIDTVQTNTDKFAKFVNKEKIIKIESVDFTGDNKKDFIVTTELDENGYKVCEYWISSDFEKIRQINTY